jgi:hypothetical protein
MIGEERAKVIHRSIRRVQIALGPQEIGYSVTVETITEFFAQKPSCTLYHYTNAAAAIGIIQNQEIWASNIRHLNDSSEFVKSWQFVAAEVEDLIPKNSLRDLIERERLTNAPSWLKTGSLGDTLYKVTQNYAPVFVASFSESQNLLSQWRAYCPHGDGYSLGFDASSFENSPLDLQLVKCIYEEEDAKHLCKQLVTKWKNHDPADIDGAVHTLNETMKLMAAIKDRAFSEECEWRLVALHGSKEIKFRSGRHGIVPYRKCSLGKHGELSLRNAWIGPNSDTQAAYAALRLVLAGGGLEHLEVLHANIPYRG